jgi:hypothetical protein
LLAAAGEASGPIAASATTQAISRRMLSRRPPP